MTMRIVDPRYPIISEVNIVDASLPNNGVIVSDDDINHPEFSKKEFELLLVQTRPDYPAVPIATVVVGGAEGNTYQEEVNQLTSHASKLTVKSKPFGGSDHEIYTVSNSDLDDDDEPYLLEDEDEEEED